MKTEWQDVLRHRARATPDATAVIDAGTGETRSYGELDATVQGIAGRLASLGVEPGDRLAVLVDTAVDAVSVLHATWRRGATLVPLNVRHAAPELERRVRRSDVDALVCEAATAEVATAVADVPIASIDPTEAVAGLDEFESRPVEPASWSVDEPQVLLFTSGTTGEPKAVPLTAGNLVASATASSFRLGVLPDDRWLLCLPVYHMGGLAPIMRSALYGTAVVVQRGFAPETTAAATREHGATGISLVPTMLRRIFDADAALSDSLRFVLLGGAPAPDELIEECERRDVPVFPTYGSTETASQIATATPTEAFERRGTVGRPLLGTDVTIVGEDGDPAPDGEVGEVVVAGPTVTPGYDGDPDATAAAFGPHGLHTGDAGYLEDGRLWVTGRLDDLIVTGGENVHPAEVADVLREHSAVRAAAIVGLDDPEWGERVAALVVASEGSAEDEAHFADALEAHARERLAGYKVPRTIAFADVLPRTASGTVDREAVRERLR